MRLRSEEVVAIKSAAREAFGADVVVRLFGSRIDDARRGGDIDLMIEVASGAPDYLARSRFLDRIERAVDGKKVDLLFMPRDRTPSAFQRLAYRDGITL